MESGDSRMVVEFRIDERRRRRATYGFLTRDGGGGERQLGEHIAFLCALCGKGEELVEQELHRIAGRLIKVHLGSLLSVRT